MCLSMIWPTAGVKGIDKQIVKLVAFFIIIEETIEGTSQGQTLVLERNLGPTSYVLGIGRGATY